MYKKSIILLAMVFGAVFISTLISNRGQLDGHIIMTRIPVEEGNSLFNSDGIVTDYKHAQIVSLDPENTESSFKILTKGFASAISPELSVDNQKLVFAGKEDEDENWQIWVRNLKGSNVTPITGKDNNCFDPVFLPDGRIAFSCTWQSDKLGAGSSLYVSHPTGTELTPITFHPHKDYSSSILHDGRILTISQQRYPESGKPKLTVLRPDGTNSGLFFKIPDDYNIASKPRENADHNIFFIAADQHSDEGRYIIQFSYKDPNNSIKILSSPESGRFHSLYPGFTGNLVVSYRDNNSKSYGIYEYDQAREGIKSPIYLDSKYNFIDPVVVGEKPFVPKKFPSALDNTKITGIMIFLESRQSWPDPICHDTDTIQVLGTNGLLREFPVACDGSFYIKLAVKTPVRFQRLNEQHEVVKGPSPWLWLMPGERRGFVGWDEMKTFVPANRLPEAIMNPPVEITGSATIPFVELIENNVVKENGHEN